MLDHAALIAEQLYREQQNTMEAHALAIKSLLEGIQSGDIDRVPTARRLIARSFKTLSESVEHLLKTTKARTASIAWLRLVGPYTASLIVLRKAFQLALSGEPMTIPRLGVDTGRAIIEEGAILQAQQVNNLYMQKAYAYMNHRGVRSATHARLTMKAAVKTVMHEQLVVDPASALQTSKWVINCALECGLLLSQRMADSKHTPYVYKLRPELEALLFDVKFVDTLSGVGRLMVSPPNHWEPSMIGGYLSPTKNPLARRMRRDDHLLCRKGLEQSPAYLDFLNNAQAVPFSIDSRAVQIVRRLWLAQGASMLSIPSINPSPEPVFPLDSSFTKETATQEENTKFLNWKHSKSEWYTAEKKRKGEASRIGLLLKEATELKNRPVYSPVFGDWRGRMYYQGTPNPQGADYSRACLQFYDKKPLGDRGLFWLKVHIANSFGYDKTRFIDRAAWVDQNMDSLVDGMLNPEDSDIYREVSDYPVLAAVSVQELVQALESPRPEEFMSGLPIHMDATCSGLQHYSAMLRDSVGGKFVNLTNTGGKEKCDIYSEVLNVAKLLMQKEGPKAELAALWLSEALDRSLTKKPVMTYVYKATQRGVSQHARQWLLEQSWDHSTVSAFAMGDYMATTLFQAIAKTVPAAAECMAWICDCVRLSGKDQPFRWRTPLGTEVVQKYRNTVHKRVYIRSCNVDSVIVLEDLDTLRMKKMADAAAPNFIHSLDSTHAALVLNRMASLGKQVVSIHDSLGTHPADVDLLHKVLREEFVKMYTEHDPLQSILDCNGLTLDKPPRGNLDLNEVLNSEFFFC